MKIKILNLILAIGIGFFISCNKDDDNSSTQDNTLNGTWNLKKVYGGFSGALNYKTGDIIWTFDTSESRVIIENNIMTATEEVNGTYDYRIEKDGQLQTLFINDIERGDIIILSENNLKLDFDSKADGFFTELER